MYTVIFEKKTIENLIPFKHKLYEKINAVYILKYELTFTLCFMVLRIILV